MSQILKAKGHVLSFLESQLGKMAVLKPLSLKRLREETRPQGAQREFCNKPDVSALPVIPLLSTRATFLGPPRSHRREMVSLEAGFKSKHNPLSIQIEKDSSTTSPGVLGFRIFSQSHPAL